MKNPLKQSTLPLMVLTAALTLVGCHRENPLLNEVTIDRIHEVIFFLPSMGDGQGHFVKNCRAYLGDQQEVPALTKVYCDTCVTTLMQRLSDRDAFQNLSDKEQFDPRLWQRVFAAYRK